MICFSFFQKNELFTTHGCTHLTGNAISNLVVYITMRRTYVNISIATLAILALLSIESESALINPKASVIQTLSNLGLTGHWAGESKFYPTNRHVDISHKSSDAFLQANAFNLGPQIRPPMPPPVFPTRASLALSRTSTRSTILLTGLQLWSMLLVGHFLSRRECCLNSPCQTVNPVRNLPNI